MPRMTLDVGRRLVVEEDGEEIFTPFEDVRCWVRIDCGGAKLAVRRHDNNRSLHWRCPNCGSYYGEARRSRPPKVRNPE